MARRRPTRHLGPDSEDFEQISLSRGGSRVPGDNAKTEEIRDYLLRATKLCFERHGVDKTTMEDVAAFANVSRPTIYRYFKNRDGLVLAVLLRALEDFNDQARELIARQPTFAEAVTETLVLAIKVGISDPYIRLVLAPEVFSLSSQLVGGSKPFHDLGAELWEPLLQQGVATGEARKNLDVKLACRWLMDVEFLLATRLLERAIEEEDIPRVVREFVLPGLLAAPAKTSSPAVKRSVQKTR